VGCSNVIIVPTANYRDKLSDEVLALCSERKCSLHINRYRLFVK